MRIDPTLIARIAVLICLPGCPGSVGSIALAETLVVAGSHQGASDENPGTEAAPLKTIQEAAERARPGDTVLVHGGEYRERVAPARGGTESEPILYLAAPGEPVVIKGSERWQPNWNRTDPDRPIFSGAMDPTLFEKESTHPYRTRLLGMPIGSRFTLGQVFVDGQPLREVDKEAELRASPATWMANERGDQLTVHFPAGTESPDPHLVEITVRDRIFAPHRRGLGYIHVRGFTMEHCANQFPEAFWKSKSPQAGALGCRAGHHWVIEENTIRFAKSIGLDCGYEGPHDLEGNQPTPQNTGSHLIRNNRVIDNGCCGIAGMRSFGTRIVDNLVEGNNWNQHQEPEIAGIKLHQFIGGRIEGNRILNNQAYGIWLDNLYRDARITRNVVVGNRGSAVFVELGQGPVLIDHNVLAHTRPELQTRPESQSGDRRADGLSTHDASGVLFTHNLVFGCDRYGASLRKRTDRPNAGVARIVLRNNLFINNQQAHLDAPLPGTYARDNWVDHNLFSPDGHYVVNRWGGVAVAEMMRSIQTVTGTRPAMREGNSAPLTLDQWNRTAIWGGENLEADRASASLTTDLMLTLDLGESIQQLAAYPVDQVTTDFFGKPLDRERSVVGPFQQLTKGEHRIPLGGPSWAPTDNER